MARAAENPCVVAKLSGLYRHAGGTLAAGADVRPWIGDAIELFGPEQLLVGSDWPVAEIDGGYEAVLGTVIERSARCCTTMRLPGCSPALLSRSMG